MRIKINQYQRQQEHLPHGHNKIFKRFRAIFEAMLNPRSTAVEWNDPDAAFIHMDSIDEELDGFCDQIIDYVCVLSGYTGIGKSTLLRHYFKTSGELVLRDDTLIVPMFLLDRFNVSDFVTRTLRSVRDFLTRKLQVQYNEDEFFNFVYAHRADLFFFGQTIPVNAPRSLLIESLQKNYPEAYALQEVKYLIQDSPIRKIIFVVDDLEAQSHDFQMKCLRQMLMVHYGMSRRPGRKYLVNTLFAIRPFTYTSLKHQAWMTAYNVNHEIVIAEAIGLLPLFKARFDFYVDKLEIKKDVDRFRSWEDAYDVLLTVAERVCDSADRTIVKLYNQDLRSSLQGLTHILTNRKWFEKPEARAHPFVTLADYRTSPNFLWRALGMGNNIYYSGMDTPIKNILLNQEAAASDLIATYVFRYLATLEGNTVEYRRATRKNLFEIMQLLFNFANKESPYLNLAIDSLIDAEILEEIDENSGVEKHLRLLPRARTLWNMLRQSSIVFEMCRDDVFSDIDPKEVIKPASLLEDVQLWEALEKTFLWVNSVEKEHLRELASKDMQMEFKNVFGTELVSRVLWQGIRYSTKVYYEQTVPKNVESLVMRLYSLVVETEKLLENPQGPGTAAAQI